MLFLFDPSGVWKVTVKWNCQKDKKKKKLNSNNATMSCHNTGYNPPHLIRFFAISTILVH